MTTDDRTTIERGPATPLPYYVNVGEMELGTNGNGYTESGYWYCITPYPDDAADCIVFGEHGVELSDDGERNMRYVAACCNAAPGLLRDSILLREVLSACVVPLETLHCVEPCNKTLSPELHAEIAKAVEVLRRVVQEVAKATREVL